MARVGAQAPRLRLASPQAWGQVYSAHRVAHGETEARGRETHPGSEGASKPTCWGRAPCGRLSGSVPEAGVGPSGLARGQGLAPENPPHAEFSAVFCLLTHQDLPVPILGSACASPSALGQHPPPQAVLQQSHRVLRKSSKAPNSGGVGWEGVKENKPTSPSQGQVSAPASQS